METLDLFSASLPENNTAENNELVNYSPLAARMRPRNFDEYVGQEQILGKGKFLRRMIEEDNGRDKNLATATSVAMHMLRDFLKEQASDGE